MASIQQLWLPKLKVERLVVKKNPQPKEGKLEYPKKFELLHHPFDLRFRGRINKWLSQLLEVRGLRLEKLADAESVKIIELYFFPQGAKKRWFNQDEVLEKVKLGNKKKLKRRLVGILLQVWQKTKT